MHGKCLKTFTFAGVVEHFKYPERAYFDNLCNQKSDPNNYFIIRNQHTGTSVLSYLKRYAVNIVLLG
jgi:hypothetical protein